MDLKGLLEWKIFAAIFAVLIVASSAVFGGGGMGSALFNSTGGGFDWGSLPFGSLFSHANETQEMAPAVENDVVIELMVDSINFALESPVSITSGDSEMSNFTGSVDFDFLTNSSLFIPSGSTFTMKKPIAVTEISGVTIESLVLEKADYSVVSGGSTTAGKDDRIEIQGFSGTITASGKLTLSGTVSSVTNGKWKIG
ncbi:MAG: hypothetical protein V1813_01440 [Candidatus Aenigmatarchaeota archaeon]